MGLQIVDGKGRGFQAEVNAEQELVVRAITEPEIEHASATLGSAYAWDSTELDIAAGVTMTFVKNTGTVPLILDAVIINGSNVICTWEVRIGALTTTPAGGAGITGVNMNEGFSTRLANAVARSGETAVADGFVVGRIKTAISGHHIHSLTGIILGKGHYVQIKQVTESTSGSAIVIGHFELPS